MEAFLLALLSKAKEGANTKIYTKAHLTERYALLRTSGGRQCHALQNKVKKGRKVNKHSSSHLYGGRSSVRHTLHLTKSPNKGLQPLVLETAHGEGSPYRLYT
jgi:hypothetical protein